MSPDERRAAIVAATLPLLVEHGPAVTTGQIATASGVAEGTVFRVFADKQELMWACLHAAFDSAGPVATLDQIPRDLPLAQRLLRASAAVADHWDRAFQIAQSVRSACPEPPEEARQRGLAQSGEKIRALSASLAAVLAPDVEQLRLSPERSAEIFLLAVTSDRMMRSRLAVLGAPRAGDVEELIEIFLHGALRGEHE
jgi:AcrR family transcriptional regulator